LLCRHLAARFGGESETLHASALVSDPQIRSSLVTNDTVKQTLDKARRAHIALNDLRTAPVRYWSR